jgi:phosphate/sulfate permease
LGSDWGGCYGHGFAVLNLHGLTNIIESLIFSPVISIASGFLIMTFYFGWLAGCRGQGQQLLSQASDGISSLDVVFPRIK